MHFRIRVLCVIFASVNSVIGQNGETTNLPPKFSPGGDMQDFSIPENTPPGTSIYKLKGVDPEGSKLAYSISGDYLSVQRNTGIVTLIRPLDRETQNFLEVIISITDEKGANAEPNTVSLRREIPILDSNDNAPVFVGKPFRANVSEATPVGSRFFTLEKIIDADDGPNAEIKLTCINEMSPLACERFQVTTERRGNGEYIGAVSTKTTLDYDNGAPKQYVMVVRAEDSAIPPEPRLSTTATIYIDVGDVPDEKPIFENSPYVQFLPENSPPGTQVLFVRVMDGDLGNLRDLNVTLLGDDRGYFRIRSTEKNDGIFVANIVTSDVTLDREDRSIMSQGERYSFAIKAVELDANGRETSDFSTADVTVLVKDVNDHAPLFDKTHYAVTIPENIKNGNAIPGLDILVSDNDTAKHARFDLSLENDENAEDAFVVYPTSGVGQAPVTIQIKDHSKLDYEDPDMRELVVRIVATQGEEFSSTATVTIVLQDANDNAPVFPSPVFRYKVSESAQGNYLITRLEATDADSGIFGEVRYSLRGFGAEKFVVNETTGDLYVGNCGTEPCLDYETQTSYSLIYVATDGGGLVTNVIVNLDVEDVNDNPPVFDKSEYRRVVSNGATRLDPPLQVHAQDKDFQDRVLYYIEAGNTPDMMFAIDPETGILEILRPVNISETKASRYNLTVVGKDSGSPPLSSETHIVLSVGFDGNEAPSFSQAIYEGTVSEDAQQGTTVLQVEASDPDGSNLELRYFLVGSGKDHFSMHNRTGIITVAPEAQLQLETGDKKFQLLIHAVDNGKPHPQTATATVIIKIEDVNNKKPEFNKTFYVHHVAEVTPVGQDLFNVTATDPDTQADLRYALSGPYVVWDKSGFRHEENQLRFFTINETTGTLKLVEALNHHSAASIDFHVRVVDVNATDKFPNQTALTDVTVYVQAHNDQEPIFNPPWSPAHPVLKEQTNEEQESGVLILGLQAHDPVTGYLISKYELVSEPDNIALEYIDLNTVTGEVAFKKRIDFEVLDNKTLEFQVRAIVDERVSTATLQLTILDVNDNSPEFSQQEYRHKVMENVRYPEPVFTVLATDKDSGPYGEIRYHLTGDLADMFQVHPTTGVVTVAPKKTLDREQQAQYSFLVVAKDHPNGGDEQKHATASVVIEVLDVNDNAPVFSLATYSAVVPENAPLDLSVTKLIATDRDEGTGGEVEYLLISEDKLKGSFSVVEKTGEVRVKGPLTGKGRAEPYKLIVRAQDLGEPQLFADVDLILYVGDMTANDGIPTFVRPALDEQATIMEDAPIGSSVFQVIATDPDDASTPNGRITYKFLDDGILGADHTAFDINSVTGLITNKVKLDRETKASYSLILVAQDQGNPVQQATRVLTVILKDVDDHSPKFTRTQHDGPLQFSVLEEVEPGWEVDTLKAVDLDEAQNAQIEYLITYGDDAGLFSLERMPDNSARLLVKGRIDHEQHDSFLLTVKCFKPSEKPSELRRVYNPQDPSEIQVRVSVKDIDDNDPVFRTTNITTGVRLNAPLYTEVARLDAFDVDSDSPPIVYKLLNVSFVRAEQVGFTFSEAKIDTSDTINKAFALDSATGSITTLITYGHFVGGYFLIYVAASSGEGTHSRKTTTTVTVYVLRDTELLKFVFNKTPGEVRNVLPSFRQDMEKALEVPLSLNLYESQFYSAEKDHVDFTSTSSCFQIVGKDHVFDSKATELLLNRVKNPSLNGVFDKYKVINVERCVQRGALYEINNVEIWLLVIGVLVGILAFVATIVVCCFFKRYKQGRKKVIRPPVVETPPIHTFVAGTLPPGSVISAPIVDNRTYEWQETAIPVDRPISRVSSAHQSLYYS